MPLIKGNKLAQEFRARLGQARCADVAVAWVGPCDAVDALAEAVADGTTRVRIVVGLSGNATNPTTLQRLHELAELRTAGDSPLFHPKYYCFRGPQGDICWVGSANLTRGGFSRNVELVHEFDDNDGEALAWFEALWHQLDANPQQAIDDYIAAYIPPERTYRPPYQGEEPELVPLKDQATWDEFVAGLRTRDNYCHFQDPGYDILGETHSYLHTIAIGHEVVQLQDWTNLGQRECDILRGWNTSEGGWGLLGSFGAAGRALHVFTHDAGDVGPTREQLRNLVTADLGPPDNIAENAQAVLNAITPSEARGGVGGFGPTTTSRLLTLAHPDRLVCVNKESAEGLGVLAGLPQQEPSALAGNYVELLHWVYRQPWFNAPEPDDPQEREIWNYRAALLDAFVYPPINP